MCVVSYKLLYHLSLCDWFDIYNCRKIVSRVSDIFEGWFFYIGILLAFFSLGCFNVHLFKSYKFIQFRHRLVSFVTRELIKNVSSIYACPRTFNASSPPPQLAETKQPRGDDRLTLVSRLFFNVKMVSKSQLSYRLSFL